MFCENSSFFSLIFLLFSIFPRNLSLFSFSLLSLLLISKNFWRFKQVKKENHHLFSFFFPNHQVLYQLPFCFHFQKNAFFHAWNISLSDFHSFFDIHPALIAQGLIIVLFINKFYLFCLRIILFWFWFSKESLCFV